MHSLAAIRTVYRNPSRMRKTVILNTREKHDVPLMIRGPKSLADRIKKIETAERETKNYVRVGLMDLGTTVYEWTAANWTALTPILQGDQPAQMLIKVLDAGLKALTGKNAR